MRWLVVVTLTGFVALIATAQTPTEFDLQKVLQTALERHPSLMAAQSRVAAARAQWRQAKARFSPRVDLTASYTQLHRDPSFTVAGMGTMVFGEGVMVSWNLFDGGATKAAVEQASEQVRQLEAALAELRNGIALEVTSAFLNVESAKQRVKTAEKAVATAEEGVRLVRLGYQNGVNTITDFLTAQAELTQAQISLVVALSDLRVAEAQLWFALGRPPEGLFEKRLQQ